MIYLNSSTSSTVIVTLYENSVKRDTYNYTWKLLDINTKEIILLTDEDCSKNKRDFNQFTFSVVPLSGTQTATGSTCGTLYANQGTYEYTVFQMENAADVNIDNALGIVEKGLLIIIGTYSQYFVNTNDGGQVVVNKSLNYYDQ